MIYIYIYIYIQGHHIDAEAGGDWRQQRRLDGRQHDHAPGGVSVVWGRSVPGAVPIVREHIL